MTEGEAAAKEVIDAARALLSADSGPKVGRMARVSRALGINQSYLAKLLNGERKSVGISTLARARELANADGATTKKSGNRFVRTTELNAFGTRLRDLMERRGVTREQLIERSGITGTIYRWETSAIRPQAKKIEALASALGVTSAELDRDGDSELSVMSSLAALPDAARDRVIEWALARWRKT